VKVQRTANTVLHLLQPTDSWTEEQTLQTKTAFNSGLTYIRKPSFHLTLHAAGARWRKGYNTQNTEITSTYEITHSYSQTDSSEQEISRSGMLLQQSREKGCYRWGSSICKSVPGPDTKWLRVVCFWLFSCKWKNDKMYYKILLNAAYSLLYTLLKITAVQHAANDYGYR